MELDRLQIQFLLKYGKEFVDVNSDLGRAAVDPCLVVKLTMKSPDANLLSNYMAAIAEIFGICWRGAAEEGIDETTEVSSESQVMGSVGAARSEPALLRLDNLPPPPPYSSPIRETGTATAAKTPPSSSVPNIEELQRRFQALKENKPK